MDATAAFGQLSGHQRIDGQLVRAGGAAIPVVDPATEELIGEISEAGAGDVAQSVAAGNAAQRAWRKVNHHRRAELLHEAARRMMADRPLVAEMLTREMGKPYKESVRRGELVGERDRLLRGDRAPRERQGARAGRGRPVPFHHQGPARRGGDHPAVQLPALPAVLAGGGGARERQRRHHQALRTHDAHHAAIRRGVRCAARAASCR